MKVQFNIKRQLLLLAILCVVSLSTFAQGNRAGTNDKVKQLKIAHITQQVDLDETEAQKFWPVYNKHQDKLRKNHERRRSLDKTDLESVPASDRERIVDEMLQVQQEEAKIKRESHNELKSVLDPVKLGKLYKAERDFKKMLLDRIGNKK